MSFLTPLYLLGGLAVSLPIVLHLLRRTPRNRMAFSSMMFLTPSPPELTRRRRLEHWLLLALRTLALLLLAVAFARPFLRQAEQVEVAAGQGQRLAVLLDASASMRRGNLWAQAVARANALLQKAEPTDDVAVYAFDRRIRPVITFEEWRATPANARSDWVRDRLADVTPGWAATHLDTALMTLGDALESTEARTNGGGLERPRRLVVISDLQQGCRLDGLQAYEWPRSVHVKAEILQPVRSTNAGLRWLRETDETQDTEDRPRLRVNNDASSIREQFRLQWADADTADDNAVDVYVPAGQSRIVRAPPHPQDESPKRLRLVGDDHDFDNIVYRTPHRPEHITVLYLARDSRDDPTQPIFYLRRAFSESARRKVTVKVVDANTSPAQADVDDADRIVVAGALDSPWAEHVRSFVSKGGRALVLLTHSDVGSTVSRLIDNDQFAVEEASVDDYTMLSDIDFTHPMFAPFAEPRFSDFTGIHVWRYRRVDESGLSNARVPARFESGDPALMEWTIDQGTLIVLSTGWHPADSQLARSTKFVPLLYGLLDEQRKPTGQMTEVDVGDAVDLPVNDASNDTARRHVRTPSGDEIQIPAEQRSFARTDRPGVYTLVTQDRSQPFAVNLAAAESRTDPLPIENLEAHGLPIVTSPSASTTPSPQQRRLMHAMELERQQNIWRGLIVAVLVVLIVETALAGRRARMPSRQEGALS